MELSDETTQPLKNVWEDKLTRQNAKTVIIEAIGQGSDVSVKVANEILDEMDRLLLEDKVEILPKMDKAR